MQRARKWQTSTLLGKLLSPSVLPLEPFRLNTNPSQLLMDHIEPFLSQYRYFQNPTQLTRQDVEIIERNMHELQRATNKHLHAFFHDKLIKSNSNQRIRSEWLRWMGACLGDNKARAQEWSNYAHSPLMPSASSFASDGFFLNLLDLVLAYSMPFCFQSDLNSSSKLLRINFNYAASKSASFVGFDKETKLIPSSNEAESTILLESLDLNGRFNSFITECFFAGHLLFRLAFLSLNQKIMKLNGELARWQQTYQDLMTSQTQDPQMTRIKVIFRHPRIILN